MAVLENQLLDKLKEQDTFLKKLSESASQVGLIVFEEKDFQFIIIDHKLFRVNKSKFNVGDAVLIVQETGQIIGKTKIPVDTLIAEVISVLPDKRLEISSSLGAKVVFSIFRDPPNPGEKVLVDTDLSIALSILPTPQHSQTQFTPISWSDIAGCTEAKTELQTLVRQLKGSTPVYNKYGLSPSKGFLFYGPPGCGKTLLGKATASELKGNFIYVSAPSILNKYVGESEATIRGLFREANQKKGVLFIDEAEAILSIRGSGRSSDIEKTIVPMFLTEMDGLTDNQATVILATNRPDVLDPAVIRDGRIDRQIHISFPDIQDQKDILYINLKNTPICKSTSTEKLCNLGVDAFLGRQPSGSAVANIAKMAKLFAARRDESAGKISGVSELDLTEATKKVLGHV